MHSALYIGTVRHRRVTPKPHTFSYRLFMVYLDLDEIQDVFRGRWLWSVRGPAVCWWRRADFLGDPEVPLRDALGDLVQQHTGSRPAGPIRMLTHLRYFGYSFNPVTFYYCFDAAGEHVETIVAQITNTPWNERFAYVLGDRQDQGRGTVKRYRFDKAFHVSPFMDMSVCYDWHFTPPGEQLAVHMRNLQAGHTLFDATLRLERRRMSGAQLARAVTQFPFMTLKVIGAIYWQAFRLWWKNVPLRPHPKHRVASDRSQQESST